MAEHPRWLLAGPWYRWTPFGVPPTPDKGRLSVPEIQKYPSSAFVEEFLAEPQRSLKYGGDDFVQRILSKDGGKYSLSKKTLESTGVRKLFLDAHSRFYLIVVELHCDMPGFPTVQRDQVCEAGFVVRRYAPIIDNSVETEVQKGLKAINAAKARIATLERDEAAPSGSTKPAAAGGRQTATAYLGRARLRGRAKRIGAEGAVIATNTAYIQGLAAEGLVAHQQQWWMADDTPGFGAWAAVDDATPQEIVEVIHPLYPLIADPNDTGHSATGRSIWFGVVPTGGSDMDVLGTPRFDDRHRYELRCFVRRHQEVCPKTSERRDCRGEVVWSQPTERYQLASHFDLTGTSNRPVTIQLPDLNALEAQAGALPFGKGIGVRTVAPPESSLQIGSQPAGAINPAGFGAALDADGPGGRGGTAICGFSIPLITIVAWFVLTLFLPIVVFVFGLWFLLRLKFCIPPSLSLEVDLALALDAEISAGADIGAEVELKIDDDTRTVDVEAGLAAAFENIHADLATEIDEIDEIDEEIEEEPDHFNVRAKLALDMATDFSESVPPDLAAAISEASGEEAAEVLTEAEAKALRKAIKRPLPSLTSELAYFPVRELPA